MKLTIQELIDELTSKQRNPHAEVIFGCEMYDAEGTFGHGTLEIKGIEARHPATIEIRLTED